MKKSPDILMVNLRWLILCIFALCISQYSLLGQATIVDGFFDQKVSGSYTLPVGIRFDQEGKAFVWEKNGKVYNLDSNTGEKKLIVDISEEVGSWGDHGLTGLALDPEFSDNGLLYLAYNVDRHHLFNFGTPNYNPDSTIIKNATIGRVSRFQLDLTSFPYQLISESKKVLLGTDRYDGFPILADFHGIGSLAFGNDGSLFVSCGDSGLDSEPGKVYHTNQAVKDGIIDSTMILGSYRSQTIRSMNGKLMRIDPETGNGLPSNPYFQSFKPRSAMSRIWSLGLRNPFKFIHIPETGSHNINNGDPGIFILGDVGSSYWEEFNIVKEKPTNFGWPLFEGNNSVWPYGFYDIENPFAVNPIAIDSSCERANFMFKDLVANDTKDKSHIFINPCSAGNIEIPDTINTYIHTRPVLYYNNVQWNQPRRTFIPGYDEEGKAIEITVDSSDFEISELFEGYSALPGAWYEEGSLPDDFSQSVLVSDFSGWIKAIKFDENYQVEKVLPLRSDVKGIVDLTLNPIDDCIYYINILSQDVRKICFGGNPPPVAVAKADTVYGGAELQVNFDASDSYDPNQLPLNLSWDFGDGGVSNEEIVSHIYKTTDGIPIKFSAVLTVKDSLGEMDTDTVFISLNNTPPQVAIISPIKDGKYAVNGYNRIDLMADVSDNEEQIDNLSYEWQIYLHHNLHFHAEEPVQKVNFSALIEPVGCAEKDEFWYRIGLTVTDSYGLKGHDETLIFPNCDNYGSVQWLRHEYASEGIRLFWEPENINGLEYFIVQRIDESGNIQDLGQVNQGNDPFDFLDYNPIDGDNRYRLKIFTNDGKYYYSTEKTARFPVLEPLLIYPNPIANHQFTLELDQPFADHISIEIYDASGRIVHKESHEHSSKDLFVRNVSTENLVAGVYFLVLKNGAYLLRKKIDILGI